MNKLRLFALFASLASAFPRRQFLGTDPTGTHSDGTLVFGSQIVTMSSVAYVADEITYSKDTKPLTNLNQVGVPTKEVLIEQIGTGSMTLQLAASTTVAPAIGSTFSLTPVGGGTALSLKVSKVGQIFKNDGETKLQVEFRDKLN